MAERSQLCGLVDSICKELVPVADEIFDNPEPGYKEYKAAALLCGWLRARGWQVETGTGGLDTAFRAEYKNGEGGPSIGLLAEYDALPMGHACGHHLQGPIILAAAEALRLAGIDKPFTLVVYGTPAEEGFGGKKDMIEAGCFKDIDVSLMTHAASNTTVDIKSYAGAEFEVTYTGVQAHESLAPEKVRSGLDALILAMQGVEFLRGHVREDVKFFCKINACHGMPGHTNNTLAVGVFSFRTYQAADVALISRRLEKVFRGAAEMTETAVEIRQIARTLGKIPSLSLNRIIMDNAAYLNAPSILPFRDRTGSTDFANVTHILPGAVSRFPLVPEGNPSHSQIYLDYGKSKEAHDGIALGAKLIALSALDLIEQPQLMREVKEEFESRKAQYEREISD